MDASTKRFYRLHRRLDHDLLHCNLPKAIPFQVRKPGLTLSANVSPAELLLFLITLEPKEPPLIVRLNALRELMNLPPFQLGAA